MNNLFNSEIDEHIETAKLIKHLHSEISIASKICIDCFRNQGKILLLGNGGSAADAQHIAAELVGRYQFERKGLPAISLSTDTSVLTSISNDFGYSKVFKRQVEALANPNDVLIAISTSGSSENIINAIKLADKLNVKTIGLTGKNGGLMNKICEVNIIVPSENTPRIQEMHILIGHIICQLIDFEFKI